MKSYRIRSGDMDVEVNAADEKDAALKAIHTYSVNALGLIMVITLVGGDPDEEGWYMSTERLLQDANINYSRVDGVKNAEFDALGKQ